MKVSAVFPILLLSKKKDEIFKLCSNYEILCIIKRDNDIGSSNRLNNEVFEE